MMMRASAHDYCLASNVSCETAEADLVILVTNIIDFEGTFSKRLALQCGPRLMIVANKVDLLPARVPRSEVSAWLRSRLEDMHIPHCGAFVTSALKKTGTRVLWEAVHQELSGRGTVAVVGAPHVGKTTLSEALSSLDQRRGRRRKRMPARKRKKRKREAAGHGV